VSIVGCIYQVLHIGFKCVLIRVDTRSDVVLDLLEATLEVNSRLLIAWRRLFQVGKRALEGDRGVVIVEESKSNGRVKRNTVKAAEGIRSLEEKEAWESSNQSSFFGIFGDKVMLPSFTLSMISPQMEKSVSAVALGCSRGRSCRDGDEWASPAKRQARIKEERHMVSHACGLNLQRKVCSAISPRSTETISERQKQKTSP
jgi:hypothetical protein